MARGELRIYLGAAPGVGKTYAMLEEGRRLRDEGADVVVAVVETHGRVATAAMLEGLEILPRREVSHRGVEITDLDVDVRQSIARIKASPFVPHKDAIRGFVFDVATGLLTEVN